MILFAQNHGPKANYNVQYETRKKKKHNMTKNKAKSTTNKQRNKAKLWSRWAKKKIESKKPNYGSLLLINST